MEKIRYLNDRYIRSPNAPIHPLCATEHKRQGSDAFGNRWFLSPEDAYLDRAQGLHKATIIVSPDGEKLIKQTPGLLTTVDDMLQLSTQLRQQTHKGITMTNYNGGRQSMTRKLHIGDNEVIIKVPIGKSPSSQPYINEMLQTEMMKRDLAQKLKAARVELPLFYFATPYVSCTRFEQGREPTIEEVLGQTHELYKHIKEYMRSQENNPLWKNVHPDTKSWGTQKYQTKNYILRPDNTLVWVDPFTYKEPHSFQDGIEHVIIKLRTRLRV